MATEQRCTLYFTVKVDNICASEYVYVTGSIPELGEWIPSKALKLVQSKQASEEWTGSIEVGSAPVQFRYFICYFLESGKPSSPKEIVISKWETFLYPRLVLPAVESICGKCRAHVVDTFGHNAGKDLVSDGWLCTENQNEILLRIRGTPFNFFKERYSTRLYAIKVSPFDLRHREAGSIEEDDPEDIQDSYNLPTLPSYSNTYLAILSNDDDPFYHEQLPYGKKFNVEEDYFVFRTRTVAVQFLGFWIELFTVNDEAKTNTPERFATAYALPASFPNTFGECTIPLLSKTNRPVGQLLVDYLVVKPLLKPHPQQTMALSYTRHWKKRKTLEVGHRGMGNSYTKVAAGRENTIQSLNAAAEKGADFVEFDVQLSKDKIPVIFHDFHVLISVAKRSSSTVNLSSKESSSDFHEMAVKDLKLKQLQLLRLDHLNATSELSRQVGLLKVTDDLDGEVTERSPFPTLVEALRKVDSSVGFNVEVKYPMMQKNGLHECENYFEHNEYLDLILSEVLTYAGDRRIVFSSFDPDICILLAAKQNKYPVLFLCVGVTTRYEPFVDVRASTSNAAVNLAASIGILGVNFHSEDLLRDPAPLHRANAFGLISFVWGDDLDNKAHKDYFKNVLLVDGVIYDRIGEVERRRNVFLVEREAKSALFRKTISPSTSRTVCLEDTNSLSDNSASSSSNISPTHSPRINSSVLSPITPPPHICRQMSNGM
uniref:Glycerophosphocholine phosphodiesterase GPCPD1 n=1 Tax=Syphacia muris TaxID=451379 RepID=A0A0N5AG98_9BILA